MQYPAVDSMKLKPGNMRISAHTDESLITLLLTAPGTQAPFLHAVSNMCRWPVTEAEEFLRCGAGSNGLEVAAGKDGKAVNAESGFYQACSSYSL